MSDEHKTTIERDWSCHDNGEFVARKAVVSFEDDCMWLTTAVNLVGVLVRIPPRDALRLAAAINARYGAAEGGNA